LDVFNKKELRNLINQRSEKIRIKYLQDYDNYLHDSHIFGVVDYLTSTFKFEKFLTDITP
jgi:hypothetical protein